MDREFSFNIDNVFNIFSPDNMEDIVEKYHLNDYYYLDQIHSDIIHIVDNKYINGSSGDAMITTKINTPLVIRTADCIPLIIYDKKNKVLATVHSGWKGVLKDTAIKTIKVMIDNYHSNVKDIYVYMYPSIKKCHFEIKDDVYNEFKKTISNIDKYTDKKDDSYYLDLQSILKDKLKELGINSIKDANICTYCHHDIYHSYRYNRTDKRNYLVAMIKE